LNDKSREQRVGASVARASNADSDRTRAHSRRDPRESAACDTAVDGFTERAAGDARASRCAGTGASAETQTARRAGTDSDRMRASLKNLSSLMVDGDQWTYLGCTGRTR
jgi:hypothetical protein